MTSAFVPTFTSESAGGRERAQRALAATTSLVLLFTGALAVLGIIFAPQVVLAIAPGFGEDPEKFALCVLLTRIMLPFVTCTSLVAMVNGALNTVQVFGTSALAQVWMNLTLIVGALVAGLMSPFAAVLTLAISVTVGGVVQIVTQLPSLRAEGFSLRPARAVITPATRQIMMLMVPALVGATVYQIGIFLNTMLASVLPSGSVSWLYYADRLVQLPIGIFSIALASVLLPALSKATVSSDARSFSMHLSNSLRFTSFLIIPVATLLAYFAVPLTQIIFEHGKFTHTATIETARAIQAYAWGIWPVSCHSMLIRTFIARKDTVTPTLIGLLTLTVNALCSLILMGAPTVASSEADLIRWLQQLIGADFSGFSLRHVGLAYASSIASWTSLLVAAFLVLRRNDGVFSAWSSATLRMALATSAAIFAANSIPSYSPIFDLFLQGLVALLCLACALWLLGSRELKETFEAIRRIRRRRGK